MGQYTSASSNLDRSYELIECQEDGQSYERAITLLQMKVALESHPDRRAVDKDSGANYLPTNMGPTENKKPLNVSGGVIQIDLAYDWYQNMTHAFVSYKLKKGSDQAEKIKVDFQEKQVTLENRDTDEVLASIDLSNAIVPAESSLNCSGPRIELKLKKADTTLNWSGIESGTATAMPVPTQTQASYPSSNKVAKNWNAIDKEIDRDLNKEKPEGDAAMNDLFKQIYERSDPDTRRAMIKSYQTSGGTVLSTNWGEVTAKDYEGKDRPDAPDGQAWAKDN